MIDWRALRQAVVDDLDSDAPRLVLADALQSVGDPRGVLIALQCELSRLGASRTRLATTDPPSAWLGDWVGDAFETGEPAHRAELRQLIDRLLDWFAGAPARARMERGFVEHVEADWHPTELFDALDLTGNALTDRSLDALGELTSLRTLRAHDMALTSAAFARLRARLLDTEITS